MISAASNCCRVDAVKASADQLKMKLAQHAESSAADPKVRSAKQQMQALDGELKNGDATKAELALSAAKSSVEQLDYSVASSPTNKTSAHQGTLDVWA